MDEHRLRFRALGSDCTVTVVVDHGGPVVDLLEGAVASIADLESRWSRFRPDSELVMLNAHAGDPVFTSPATAELVALSVEAWSATDGCFDPTVHDALVASGYDRTFDDVVGREVGGPPAPTPDVPGAAGIEVEPAIGLVVLPHGCHVDLGGIGKGRAADLVLDQLLEAGAAGACVDLGGDVRVGGSPVDGGEGWVVAVDDPFRPGRDLARIRLTGGAVTTSSVARRRWGAGEGSAHHLIDPATGRPTSSGLTAATVVAGTAAWGEAHAKAAIVAGPVRGRRLVEDAGLCALLVADDGETVHVGPLRSFLVEGPPS